MAGDDREHFPFLRDLDLPPRWEAAAARFLGRAGVVMVLGEPDAGKSTLCRYLVYRAFRAGRAAALVDLDLGQSHLGPPAALGLGLFPPRFPGDESLIPDALHFIGQTSPVGALLEVAVGCRVLSDQALQDGAELIVVNTSGFVHGPGAARLKRAEWDLLQPHLLLTLERAGELTPLVHDLALGDPERVLRLPVSVKSRRRLPEERRRQREARFGQYFSLARRLTLPLADLHWQGLPWGRGLPLTAQDLAAHSARLGIRVLYGETGPSRTILLVEQLPAAQFLDENGTPAACISWPGLKWRLAGLLDHHHRTLALGLVFPSAWDKGQVTFLTPLSPDLAGQVRAVKVGKLRVTPQGQELP
jgi:polynucleotide 5'-hydroxyl-kinase GRC3/NOL9